MIHGVSLANRKAEWYRNRWVRTRAFTGEQRSMNPFDLRSSVANTNVMAHAGRIMALVENALPMEMSRELDTVGYRDFDGALKTPFTAHPKICPTTGEMHFFGYGLTPPYLTYHMADAAGCLQRSIEVPVRAATMVHDFALTASHVVFMDLPVVFDMVLAMRGTMPFKWSDKYGARLGILPRGGGIEALRWVEIEACYVFHVGNAFEEPDGTIVVDVAWYKDLWRGGPSATKLESATLRRWPVLPGATKTVEERLDERALEFPPSTIAGPGCRIRSSTRWDRRVRSASAASANSSSTTSPAGKPRRGTLGPGCRASSFSSAPRMLQPRTTAG